MTLNGRSTQDDCYKLLYTLLQSLPLYDLIFNNRFGLLKSKALVNSAQTDDLLARCSGMCTCTLPHNAHAHFITGDK